MASWRPRARCARAYPRRSGAARGCLAAEIPGPLGFHRRSGRFPGGSPRVSAPAPRRDPAFTRPVFRGPPRSGTPVLDHTSICALVEAKWNLPAMTYRDANANAMLDMLDLRLSLIHI